MESICLQLKCKGAGVEWREGKFLLLVNQDTSEGSSSPPTHAGDCVFYQKMNIIPTLLSGPPPLALLLMNEQTSLARTLLSVGGY